MADKCCTGYRVYTKRIPPVNVENEEWSDSTLISDIAEYPMMAELSESPHGSQTHSDAFAEMYELASRQVTERSRRSNG